MQLIPRATPTTQVAPLPGVRQTASQASVRQSCQRSTAGTAGFGKEGRSRKRISVCASVQRHRPPRMVA